MSAHANSSPSGAEGWMSCAGWRSSGESSKYADEGTDAHTLGSVCLENGRDAVDYLGIQLPLGHKVTPTMAAHVQKYVDLVRALPGFKLIEQGLPLEPITGEPDAKGTGDAISLDFDALEIIVADLKYGTGIRVSAIANRQLKHYGLAAMLQYEQLAPWKTVRGIISQPRLDHVSEDTWARADLLKFKKESKKAATAHRLHQATPLFTLWAGDKLRPGKKSCQWCVRKKPTGEACPAYAAMKISENVITFSPIGAE